MAEDYIAGIYNRSCLKNRLLNITHQKSAVVKTKPSIAVLLICCLMGPVANSQEGDDKLPNRFSELGLPYIQNYPIDIYGASSQNFAVAQSKEGLMYIGNNDGVLEYDGISWRLIQLPNKGVVRSLLMAKDNKLYVGGYNDLGYLAADATGRLQFVSLAGHLDKKDRSFRNILHICSAGDCIYFQGDDKLFVWKRNTLRVIKTSSRFELLKTVNNDLYTVEKGPVIKKLVNNSFKEIIDAGLIRGVRVTDILPYKDGRVLILTLDKGLFITKGNNPFPFETDANKYLIENKGRNGIKLGNGWYSFATFDQGIIVMSGSGEVVKILDKVDGIADNTVFYQYEDKQKGLWLATDNGISRLEILSPFTVFDERLGVQGFVNRLYRQNGKLYAANFKGVLQLEPDGKKKGGIFKRIQDSAAQAFYFLSLGDTLLTATIGGTDMVLDTGIIKRFNYKSTALLRSGRDPNRVFIGLLDGLASLKYDGSTWKDDGMIKGIKDDIREIVEDKNGNLWLESQVDGIWRVVFNGKDFHDPAVKHFRAAKELPEGVLFLHYIRGKPLFDIDDKIYNYDERRDSILPDMSLSKQLGLSGKISLKMEDRHGNIWMWAQLKKNGPKARVVALLRADGSYQIKKIHDERIAGPYGTSLLPEDNGVVWYGGSQGIIRHDMNLDYGCKNDFYTLIREVSINNDSLIFGGAKTYGTLLLPYKMNGLRLGFAATSFEDEHKNLFQYYLEGFDKDWSQWTTETQKDYTNIPEGDYTFKVRSKNIFGKVGVPDGYSFTILPPWYRTWWAYLIYAALAGLLTWLFSLWRSQQLYRKNLILEGIIKRRTEQIRQKNEQLSHQTEKLKEMDTMKTRLFANISHEFRTPLTLIKGPIEKLEEARENKISTVNIKMIRRNANRLLNLIDQLLELSKLDSGKLRLNEAEGDVFKCIRAAASAFSSHAASRNMDYQIRVPSEMLWASFDRDKLEKIIYNLLSNAFKFTEDEGKVIIEAEFRGGRLRVKVSDTGGGIATQKLPHIFDRFFQVDHSYTREKAGSGIGLALTKELTELMGGTIYVESELGKGSIFKAVLPMEEIRSYKRKEPEELRVAPFHDNDDWEETTVTETDGKDTKVLVIEDNNDMRHFIREQLEPQYTVLEAVNGKEGLKLASKIVPDLIITDLMMPRMDGITLCKNLKTNINTSHIPVIMLTAKAGLENKLEGLETGADDYLIKPFNAKELRIRAKNLIEQRQQLRELFSKNISLDPKEITVTSLDEKFLQQVLTLLEDRYPDSQFGVPQMQKGMGMSKTALHNKVKTLTNHPPGELLRNFRLKRAVQLLTQKADNISQIAYDTGFNSLSYFTKCFKELYGMSPSEYIQKKP